MTTTVSATHNTSFEFMYNDINLLNNQNQNSLTNTQTQILMGGTLGGVLFVVSGSFIVFVFYQRNQKKKQSINILSKNKKPKRVIKSVDDPQAVDKPKTKDEPQVTDEPQSIEDYDLEAIDVEMGMFNLENLDVKLHGIPTNNLGRVQFKNLPQSTKDEILKLKREGKLKASHLTNSGEQLQHAQAHIVKRNKIVVLNLETLAMYNEPKPVNDEFSKTIPTNKQILDPQTVHTLNYNELTRVNRDNDQVQYSPINIVYRSSTKTAPLTIKRKHPSVQITNNTTVTVNNGDDYNMIYSPLNLVYKDLYKSKNKNFDKVYIKKVKRIPHNSLSITSDVTTSNKERIVYSPINVIYSPTIRKF